MIYNIFTYTKPYMMESEVEMSQEEIINWLVEQGEENPQLISYQIVEMPTKETP